MPPWSCKILHFWWLLPEMFFFHGKKLNITKNWLFSTKNYFFENCSEMSTITPKVLKNEFLGVFDAYFATNTCVNIQSPTSPKSQHFMVETTKSCNFGLVGDWMFTQVFVVKYASKTPKNSFLNTLGVIVDISEQISKKNFWSKKVKIWWCSTFSEKKNI